MPCNRNQREQSQRDRFDNRVVFASSQYNAFQLIPIAADIYLTGGEVSIEWAKGEAQNLAIDVIAFLNSQNFDPIRDELIGDVMTFQCWETILDKRFYGPNTFVPILGIRSRNTPPPPKIDRAHVRIERFPFSGRNGVLYRVERPGNLDWYKHVVSQDFNNTWAQEDAVVLAPPETQWNKMEKVFSGGNGTIYAIEPDGSLRMYCHHVSDRFENTWEYGGGSLKLAERWAGYDFVFAGDSGEIYVSVGGAIYWYKHIGRQWLNGGAAVVLEEEGWDNLIHVFSGGGGTIYTVDLNGDMHMYTHHVNQETFENTWTNKNGIRLGREKGWAYRDLFSGGNNTIYTVDEEGKINWYRHDQAGNFQNSGNAVFLAENW